MSSESLPITSTAFAAALKDLTIPLLYAKVFELRNSISHLERSNTELKQYIEISPGGDEICQEAISENEEVIKRMLDRIDLVKAEVEARGQEWIELNGTDTLDETSEIGLGPEAEDIELPDAPITGSDNERLQVGQPQTRSVESNGASQQESMGPRSGGNERQQEDESEGVLIPAEHTADTA
uniref:Uncharacterized protein n=1 Tax=Coccidioides posadasii RMSCC 3488 TaxID=454284 RepID=A0A0J6F5L0_COCPO|nr:hypothetical protein CPAG_04527 [Coccidioides posadasii RMSCC 3488]